MWRASLVVLVLVGGCVVKIPDGQLQFLCDRSISERPQHVRCNQRFPVAVIWNFK
jgi:hypothetical protein